MNTFKNNFARHYTQCTHASSLTTIEPANARAGGGGRGFRGVATLTAVATEALVTAVLAIEGRRQRLWRRGLGDDRFGRGDDGPLNHVSESALRRR
jgi:hypothetical protein